MNVLEVTIVRGSKGFIRKVEKYDAIDINIEKSYRTAASMIITTVDNDRVYVSIYKGDKISIVPKEKKYTKEGKKKKSW